MMGNANIKTNKSESQAIINTNLNILILKSEKEEEIVNQCLECRFKVQIEKTNKQAINVFEKDPSIPIVVAALGIQKDESDYWQPFVKKVRKLSSSCFIIIFSYTAASDPLIRNNLFEEGVNMVTSCLDSLKDVLIKIKNQIANNVNMSSKGKGYTCPICFIPDMDEDSLWVHLPLYHINHDPKLMKQIKSCPICLKHPSPNLQVHYRNLHGPGGRGETHSDFEEPVSLYAFALVVVYRKEDNKFLLVQEFAKSGFWLPGGRVDAAENLDKAAIRETKEEAGIDINLKGILTIQFEHSHGRLRIIYYAEPKDVNQKPKSIPDYESVGASWATLKDLETVPLRGNEPAIWIDYVLKGNQIYPLSIFSKE